MFEHISMYNKNLNVSYMIAVDVTIHNEMQTKVTTTRAAPTMTFTIAGMQSHVGDILWKFYRNFIEAL